MSNTVSPAGRGAMEMLLYGFFYAQDLDVSVWQFAVELEELRRNGCTHNDIRWLVFGRLVEFARETTCPHGNERTFELQTDRFLDERTSFVLTEPGVLLARRLVGETPCQTRQAPAEIHSAEQSRILSLSPRWDRQRQELRLGHYVIKRFRSPAANQERVLTAFEEEGWPLHIDDPLPPCEDRDPKRRLHDTINALNRNHHCPLLRFSGDGRGEGVRWDKIIMPLHGSGYDLPPGLGGANGQSPL